MQSASSPILYHKSIGHGRPVFILHGLFGSSDNWSTFAKRLAEDYQVISVDLRNHGRSFHHNDFSLKLVAEDLINLVDHLQIDSATWVGHSLGGKCLMQLDQHASHRIEKMVIIDIAPKAYPPGHQLYFDAMQNLSLDLITTRKEAEQALSRNIADQVIVQFLLKNLQRTSDGFRWKFNLSSLKSNYNQVIQSLDLAISNTPVLFVKGARSDYILPSDEDRIKSSYNHYAIVSIDNAGHWVHADQPQELLTVLKNYIN